MAGFARTGLGRILIKMNNRPPANITVEIIDANCDIIYTVFRVCSHSKERLSRGGCYDHLPPCGECPHLLRPGYNHKLLGSCGIHDSKTETYENILSPPFEIWRPISKLDMLRLKAVAEKSTNLDLAYIDCLSWLGEYQDEQKSFAKKNQT